MLDPLLAFFITLAFITGISLKYRVIPFFTLIGGALVFGLLAGMDPDTIVHGVVDGLGTTFGMFGIIILSGSVIARMLVREDLIGVIVSDMRRCVQNPSLLAGTGGYLLAVPVSCCITAFLMLAPFASRISGNERLQKDLVYITALGTLSSFAFLYPTPVTIPLFSSFSPGVSPLWYDALALPVSLVILGGVIIAFTIIRGGMPEETRSSERGKPEPRKVHVKAWLPFIVILFSIPTGTLIGLSSSALIQFIMLAGAACAIILARPAIRIEAMAEGVKHGGVIIFDICGAGALGYVIVQGGFAAGLLSATGGFLPILCVPFVVAALIQTAQGSRVVTAVITGEIIAGTGAVALIHPLILILMIAAGTCVISYVTDPYFWLVHRATGDEMGVVVRKYTVPLAIAGLAVFLFAAGLQVALF